jgi:hypothetical protein
MSHKLSPGAVEVSLPEILENRLKSYSMAAAAAGVGLLALAHPADAEVVITHKVIQVTNSTVSIDINHDGIADFQFGLYSSENGYFFGGNATIKPLVSGGVVGGLIPPRGTYFASALKRDVEISRFKHFVSNKAVDIEGYFGSCKLYSCGYDQFGNWGSDPQNSYLGVKFQIDGEIHYGWVRLKVTPAANVEIESYAYETEPDTPICAREVQPCPAPPNDSEETSQNVSGGPSLGMLALGTDGLALWRREEALSF